MKRILFVAFIVFLCAACSSPTGPTDGGTDRLTATIDGQPFTATIIAAMIVPVNGGPNLNIVGLNGCQGDTTVNLQLQPASAVGTFTSGQAGVNWVTGGLNRMSGGQSVGSWGNSSTSGNPSGTITITSLSSTRVAGTFDFPVLRQNGGGAAATTRSLTNGSFDIQLAERKIC